MSGLSPEQIEATLSDPRLAGWRLGDGELVKNYKFGSFMEAIQFIVRMAEKAESANHHPDIENHYNRVRVALHTWNEHAITPKDVALAREIESIAHDG